MSEDPGSEFRLSESLKGASRPLKVKLLVALCCLMFFLFALTTDAVGVIIPEVIRVYGLSHTEAGAFHYATMAGIAVSGLGFGFVADRIGRKTTILLGLSLFALSAALFPLTGQFSVFAGLLFLSGLSIGLFKTAAQGVIGDLAHDDRHHTRLLNLVEGFFGLGAILGPLIVTHLLLNGASWSGLYVLAAGLCLGLMTLALGVRFPQRRPVPMRPGADDGVPIRWGTVLRDPWVLSISGLAMLYVGVETAVYVWMPTLLKGYEGALDWLALYALPVFFVLRALGRFIGVWMLASTDWTRVLAVSSGVVLVCFVAALVGGPDVAVFSLPVSGLFMSVIYPTLNSKGLSGFPQRAHGTVGGVILFFTALSAVLAPLAMGAVADQSGHIQAGFGLATVFAALLFAALLANAVRRPGMARLQRYGTRDAD